MSKSDAERAAEQLGPAIDQVVGTDMVVKWVAVVEVLTGDEGERGLWLLTPKGATAWDTLGMLGFAIEIERASIHRGDD
jgi:hypothetical protein